MSQQEQTTIDRAIATLQAWPITFANHAEIAALNLAIAALRAQQAEGGWHPSAEPPTDTITPVLVYYMEGGMAVRRYSQRLGAWIDVLGQRITTPTHWMRLPQPPLPTPAARKEEGPQ
jgi:hypothetical protein